MTETIPKISKVKYAFGGLLVALLILSWFFVQATGTEISMCVKDSGDSYVIGTGFKHQSCKNNEQLLTFSVTGPQGSQGPQGPVGPEGASVKVYDDSNTVIGYVTSSNGIFSSSNPEGDFEMFDKKLKAFVHISSFVNQGASITSPFDGLVTGRTVYYASNDCSGQAYMNDLPAITQNTLIALNSTGYYYAIDHQASVPSDLNYQSSGVNNILAVPCVQETGTLTSPMPVKDAQVILDSYVRPFHIGL